MDGQHGATNAGEVARVTEEGNAVGRHWGRVPAIRNGEGAQSLLSHCRVGWR